MRHILAVGAGKGGVGKSTIAVNLAVAMADRGLRVGIADADIYGPSVARMLGVSGDPVIEGNKMHPLTAYGVQVMSMAFLFAEETAAIWRGPMTSKALYQLMRQTVWDALDVLIVDMPPGTGDVQLSLMEQYSLKGVVMVSTPQLVALADVKRAITMCQKLEIPVLGIIENMHHFMGEDGCRYPLFGEGNVAAYTEAHQIPYLGSLPIDPAVTRVSDHGLAPLVRDPHSLFGVALTEIAERLSSLLC